MLGKIKKLTLQMLAGANIATVILMWLVGNVDRLNPVDHPILSSFGLIYPAFMLINMGFLVFFACFKWKYLIIPLIGFVACYSPTRHYWPINLSHDTPNGSIKVLTYNVFNFSRGDAADGEPNPTLIYIVGSDADIVCLQEARIDAEVISMTKNTYKYIDSVKNAPIGDCLVVMSKYPIVGKERIDYPSKANLSAAFKIKIDNDTVIVINNHFETSGLSIEDRADFKEMVKGHADKDSMRSESKRLLVKLGESASIRAPQAEAVARYIDKTKGNIILCGDFNDNPLSYTHHVLEQRLTDCYVATANGPGVTYHHNAIYVRIDNIMCSADWTPYNCTVDKSNAASDHYPVYCWLKKTNQQ